MLKLMAFMSSWAHCLPIVAIRQHFCAGGWILLETFRVRAFEVYFAHSEGSLVTRRVVPVPRDGYNLLLVNWAVGDISARH